MTNSDFRRFRQEVFRLYGAPGNAEEFAEHWQGATADGWLVGIPQSSQMIAPGRFGSGDALDFILGAPRDDADEPVGRPG